MRLLAAIDVLDGEAVRLRRGDFGALRRFGRASELAAWLTHEGADSFHVVDLAQARDGGGTGLSAATRELVETLARDGAFVEVGGGLRSVPSIEDAFAAGATRVVLGTALLGDEPHIRAFVRGVAASVVAALDYRETAHGPRVAVEGWQRTSEVTLGEAMGRVLALGIERVLVTAVARDGMGTGPAVGRYQELIDTYPVALIASGGIGVLEDLENLASLRGARGAIEAAVVGTALLEGRFTVQEARARCEP